MKRYILLLFVAAGALAQTTTITANTPIIDHQGNLLTGSLCLGAALFNSSVSCQNITNGTMASYTVPNGTYSIWLNEGTTPIFTITNIQFNGTPVASDTYLSGQFAVLVGSTYVFPSTLPGANPSPLGLTCNGNAVTLMGNPQQNQEVQISNLSGTTACTVAGNGSSIFYQGASVSPQSVAAKNSWIGVYVYNYDQAGLGHNAWIVSHLGT
jgi:hypothetical protein